MKRRNTSELKAGNIRIGANNPILVQSMCNTPTTDTESTVDQIIRIFEAGGEMVRTTVINVKEAGNLIHIKELLKEKGYAHIPLVADIHFNPDAAFIAAKYYDKVRINPGNFVDRRAIFKTVEFTEDEYSLELNKIEEKLVELINLCKENNTALRIGTNHGSLSDRIMTKYGNTPAGMVESTMEFLRICKKHDFENLIISMKSSNAYVMVSAVRLLVETMNKEQMNYPLHLGVTEAGEGEDGIIKSCVGLGALLCDGIGDTIRVSLTDEPENEIPVAKAVVNYFASKENDYSKLSTIRLKDRSKIGQQVKVLKQINQLEEIDNSKADNFFTNSEIEHNKLIKDIKIVNSSEIDNNFISEFKLKNSPIIVVINSDDNLYEAKNCLYKLEELNNDIYLHLIYNESNLSDIQIKVSCDLGQIIIDKAVNGISLINQTKLENFCEEDLLFDILQSGGVRVTKTEFVSCPGCGRTQYDLQATTQKVKKAIGYDTKFKIAVMGCIINGPGEMADADFGYVGSGKNKVSLYKKQKCIKRNIDENEAVEILIEEIKKAENEIK
jgi:(E)-4-hydroxy-3-methylbut-2-enyl-diphosphate synthase